MKSAKFLFIILLTSCLPEEPAFHVGREKELPISPKSMDVGKTPSTKFVDAFGLKTNVQEFDVNSMRLHGKFFNNRISFYTVNDPGMKIHGIEVKSMTLYFIDSALMRKKYLLSEDISSPLIKTFGNFKFTPLHNSEKVALQNKEVLERRNGKVVINKKLANYQLKWVHEVNTLSYRSQFNFSDSTSTYELVQEVNYYKPYFRIVESMD